MGRVPHNKYVPMWITPHRHVTRHTLTCTIKRHNMTYIINNPIDGIRDKYDEGDPNMTITYNTRHTALYHFRMMSQMGCDVTIDNRTVTVRKVTLVARHTSRVHMRGF